MADSHAMLNIERTGIERVGICRRALNELITYARRNGNVNGPLRQKLAELNIEIVVLRWLCYRVAWMHDEGIATEWHAAMAKLYSTELYKHAASTALQLLGMYGQLDRQEVLAPLHGWFENYYLISFGATIAAGTSEIQRTIIALRGLELPRA